jgi:Arc/MetJ-type ribon-helix-helix transcriptional regulator
LATKEAQINLRLPGELDAWVESHAGGKRRKPEYIRQLIEREKQRQEEAELLAMFNAAWDGLTDEERDEERAERESLLGGFTGREP